MYILISITLFSPLLVSHRAFVGPTLGGYMVDRFGFMHTATGLAMLNFVVMWIILLFSMWEYRCGKGYVSLLSHSFLQLY